MGKVLKIKGLPNNSIIGKNIEKIDYEDCFRIEYKTDETVDQVVTRIFNVPAWVNGLMNIRNALVKVVGLQTEKNEDMQQADFYPIGSRAVLFTVIDRNENEIVTGEHDKHLDFRASILVDRNSSYVYLSTIVHYNKKLGNVYFFFVKPFHKMIMKSLLKRELKNKK